MPTSSPTRHQSPSPGVICPKCGVNPLTGNRRWCLPCNAQANKEYRRKKKSLINRMVSALEKAGANGKEK